MKTRRLGGQSLHVRAEGTHTRIHARMYVCIYVCMNVLLQLLDIHCPSHVACMHAAFIHDCVCVCVYMFAALRALALVGLNALRWTADVGVTMWANVG